MGIAVRAHRNVNGIVVITAAGAVCVGDGRRDDDALVRGGVDGRYVRVVRKSTFPFALLCRPSPGHSR